MMLGWGSLDSEVLDAARKPVRHWGQAELRSGEAQGRLHDQAEGKYSQQARCLK